MKKPKPKRKVTEAKPDPVEICEICNEPCDPGSVSSCECCGRTICEHCREWDEEESFCPSCFSYIHQCKLCAWWLGACGRGGVEGACGNPESPQYGSSQCYQRECEFWKRITPDFSRDALRRIGPLVGEVRSALHGMCAVYEGGPGSKECKGFDKKITCPLWSLCRHMKNLHDGQW